MRILFLIFIFSISVSSRADEGMWMPNLISTMNIDDMQSKGLYLSAEDIYSITKSSLKDAVVALSWGNCTGEIISKEGLLLTNHHCADDLIQFHSTTKKDYLKNGFWAMSKSEELPNENLTASILVRIENVTERVFSKINGSVTEDDRRKKIRAVANEISNEISDTSHYNSRLRSFYGGNEFYLFIYETFLDVRLVGAPPSSIGKFGGDTDNWMWPRHTGDFTLLRIYADTNNKPAKHSKENVPYKPKYHFKIQLDGVENNDFTIVYGFPGSTDRYLTSFGVSQALKLKNKTIIDIRSKKLEIMKEGMDKDRETYLKYATKYSSVSNYWKYYIGQNRGLRKLKVLEKKKNQEKNLKKWIHSGGDIKVEKYKNVLPSIENAYKKNEAILVSRTYLNEAIFRGPEILYFSYSMQREIKKAIESRNTNMLDELEKKAVNFYKNYDESIDEKMLSAMLEMYYYNVPEYQHPSIFKKIKNQPFSRSLDFDYFASQVFKKSIYSSQNKFSKFIKTPSLYKLSSDPSYQIIESIYSFYTNNISQTRKEVRDELSENNRLFISALKEMNSSNPLYSNANSTLRLSYGNVKDYIPSDAIHYDYYTTIAGIIEKEDSANEEFVVPEKLIDLYNDKNFGRYADSDGNLRVNFIDNNDITGGNSGSPVLNAYGELVGTAFDGNWEAMSGDIMYEQELQRCISVDIRYILFIIDKYAEAGYLIDEMTIAKTRKQ